MTDTVPVNIVRRFRYTPLRDVARGRLTGRLDLAARIRASGLPGPAQSLIRRVVRRTHLWRLEKTSVADELTAHFADGIASGETVDSLIESFGGERVAARLIRRAKWRSRPLIAHALAAMGWALVALLVAYVLLGVYLYTGKSSPKVDYIALANAETLRTAPADRAWPLYQAALLSIRQSSESEQDKLSALLDTREGYQRWPELMKWVDEHANTLELIRAAARKPTVGFLIGPGGSVDDPAQKAWAASLPADSILRKLRAFNDYASLNQLARLGSVLAADARVARARGDASRFVEDLDTIGRLTEHMRHTPYLMVQHWALGARSQLLQELEQAMVRRPALLSDRQLQDLAHRLAGPQIAADFFDLSGNRMEFQNAVQLAYTDDGAGSGRLTPQGLRAFAGYFGSMTWISETSDPLTFAVSPAYFAVSGSRADEVAMFNRLSDEAEARYARPLREVGIDEDALGAMTEWRFPGTRYLSVAAFNPQPGYMHQAAEIYLARRDALLVAIALELHHRRQGTYPESLAVLMPSLLPAIPVDRITGGPLSYHVFDGKPVVYSFGADHNDDGGRVPVDETNAPRPWSAVAWTMSPKRAPGDGDWILYPEPIEPELEIPAED